MFAPLDWLILSLYLILALVAGLALSKKASSSMESYFLANRNLPWWWLGTSMVATTFAADTPLAITGITVKQGIAGNWFWWSWALTYMAGAVFFARKWRKSEVLTDIEFIELRYGAPGAQLRLFKAGYMSLVMNSIILGWVFRAMAKITTPFLHWNEILPASMYDFLLHYWPSFLLFGVEGFHATANLNHTMTLVALFAGVVLYSILGGIRGVIVTDLLQFAMAMTGSFIFAYLAVDYAGGMDQIVESIQEGYAAGGSQKLSIMPDLSTMTLGLFAVYFLVQWWSQYFSDGSGYLAQRMNTARTPEDATRGSMWFVFANFMLRTWPWVLVGLATLAIFPLAVHDSGLSGDALTARCAELSKGVADIQPADARLVCVDPEMGYPVLMKYALPAGLLGFVFAGLMAAFMSTVDTHINWAGSYLVNDIYLRFVRPEASQRKQVRASRWAVFLVAAISLLVASQIGSIEEAWKFLIALAAGMGLPQLLRWVWWRANAYTEISGMVASLLLTILMYTTYPFLQDALGWGELRAEYGLVFTALGSAIICITITLWTPPTPSAVLDEFQKRIQPTGFWPNVSGAKKEFWNDASLWFSGNVAILAGMLVPGYLLLDEYGKAIICLILAVPAALLTHRLWSSRRF
ncbi:MAG: Na+:solute symporter [Leptospiraceae bacterium]|nr:Na+:solute symporter [Leptospiraceae bacterium]